MLPTIKQPYLIELSLILALGYIVYRLFFAEDKNFIRNRIYLMSLLTISFLLPLLSLPVYMQQVMYSSTPTSNLVSNQNAIDVVDKFTWMSFVEITYFSIVVLLSIRLVYHIVTIVKIILTSESVIIDGTNYVITDKLSSPASIFDKLIVRDTDLPQEIIDHEKVHIAHGHTIDILITEVAKVILWFNPFIYLFSKSLKENHEYTADHIAANLQNDELDYSLVLIQFAKESKTPLLLNTFSSITKKRIIMLSKEKVSKPWKLLLIVPMLFCMASVFAFDTYNVPIATNVTSLIDTIPDIRIDTIVTFDYDTGKESMTIEKIYLNEITEVIDTVVVFDTKTQKESIQIVKAQNPKKEVLLEQYTTNRYNATEGVMESKTYNRYPQELVQVVDTIVTFDYDTYEEKTTIIEGARAREELISTVITPKEKLKKDQKFDNIFKSTDKIIIKKKGN